MTIADAFDAYVAKCQGLAKRLAGRGNESLRLFVRPSDRVRWLAERAEQEPEFLILVAALPPPPDVRLLDIFDAEGDGGRWLLRNAGLYHDVVNGVAPSLATLLDLWRGQKWGMRRLYLLDGISVIGEITLPSAKILQLAPQALDAFFTTRSRQAFGTPFDTARVAGYTFLEVELRRVLCDAYYVEEDRTFPWLGYLSLYGPGAVVVASVFERPSFEFFSCDEYGQMLETVRDNQPSVTTASATDLQLFVDALEIGRRNASSPRIDLALRNFSRASTSLFGVCEETPLSPIGWDEVGDDYPAERAALERGLIDLAITMEGAYLDSSRGGKKHRLSELASALLARNDGEQIVIERQITDSYNVRNRLVHSDVSPTYRELYDAAAFLRRCARRSLVALLRMDADRSRLIAALGDQRLRDANRSLVPD